MKENETGGARGTNSKMRPANKVLVRKVEGNRPLERPSSK
jgi:hypothetical protein